MLLGIAHAISRGLAWLVIAGALAAYLWPEAFRPVGGVFLPLFALTMFAIGLVLPLHEAKAALQRPGALLAGVAAQYSVMPALGALAGWTALKLGLSAPIAAGFVIVGCAPGAMASNAISYLAGGATAFSVGWTMLATLASPVLTPLLVSWLAGAALHVPVGPMMRTITLYVAAPLLLGIALQRHIRPWQAAIEAWAPALASVAIVLICAYAVAANHARIADAPLAVFALVVAVNLGGYLLGWAAGALFGFDPRLRLTLAIEVGMQNAGLGAALALKHFPALAALPAALFAFWCVLTASMLARRARAIAPV
ncbi:MAG: bile acid:sodium symporter family protein [Zetaproteobacteria bacterium]|nr:MAG: bile acid:sodium symporter family protein [Zetaproteobacteria bacterium]